MTFKSETATVRERRKGRFTLVVHLKCIILTGVACSIEGRFRLLSEKKKRLACI